MRVSLIDPSLFTFPYDQDLAGGLTHAGHDVTLFGRRPGPEDGDATGVLLIEAFYRLAGRPMIARWPKRLRLGVKGLDHLWSMARLARRLRRDPPDIIHFQWLPLPLVDHRLLSLYQRIAPLVLTVHDTNPFNGSPTSRLQSAGVFSCFARFDQLIVHTEQGHARLRGQGVPAGRLTVVPHGMPQAIRPTTHADANEPDTLTFVLFGKIKPYKGADLLIESFSRLPEDVRARARVRIVGKPYMDLAPLFEMVRARGLEGQVSIEPRFVADAEIASLFGPGTIAVFPYREIDTSGVLGQALSYGRPIIAAKLGAFAEMLRDGVHGRLVATEDATGLAGALAQFVSDRSFMAACCRQARALSENGTSWDAAAFRTVAVYEAAMAAWVRARSASRSTDFNRATDVRSSTRKITGGNC